MFLHEYCREPVLYGWRNGFVYSRLTEARTGRSARRKPSQATISRLSLRLPGAWAVPSPGSVTGDATREGELGRRAGIVEGAHAPGGNQAFPAVGRCGIHLLLPLAGRLTRYSSPGTRVAGYKYEVRFAIV